jgi:type I restriction enzyme S subunit
MSGNAITRLTLEKINKLKFPIPPTLAEQEAIAEALSDADALIEALEQLLAKKRQVKQGAMQELLTGKRRLPGFNSEWKEKVFTDICNLVHGYQFRTNDFIDHEDGIKVIKIGNVLDGYFDIEHCDYISKNRLNEFSGYLIKQGDILMSLTGNIGRVVRVGTISEPLLQNYRVGKFVPINVDANFLTYCLASPKTTMQLEYFANQAAQANFGKQDFEKIKVDVPTSIEEQTAIAEILSDMDAEIAALEGKLAKARQVKQGMMQELLTGGVRLL